MGSRISKGCNTKAKRLKETTPEAQRNLSQKDFLKAVVKPLLYQRSGGKEVLIGKNAERQGR